MHPRTTWLGSEGDYSRSADDSYSWNTYSLSWGSHKAHSEWTLLLAPTQLAPQPPAASRHFQTGMDWSPNPSSSWEEKYHLYNSSNISNIEIVSLWLRSVQSSPQDTELTLRGLVSSYISLWTLLKPQTEWLQTTNLFPEVLRGCLALLISIKSPIHRPFRACMSSTTEPCHQTLPDHSAWQILDDPPVSCVVTYVYKNHFLCIFLHLELGTVGNMFNLLESASDFR
jgi:hypothetical protein